MKAGKFESVRYQEQVSLRKTHFYSYPQQDHLPSAVLMSVRSELHLTTHELFYLTYLSQRFSSSSIKRYSEMTSNVARNACTFECKLQAKTDII